MPPTEIVGVAASLQTLLLSLRSFSFSPASHVFPDLMAAIGISCTSSTVPSSASIHSGSSYSRTACERCYKNKEKCRFDDNRQSCFRCRRLDKPCQPRKRRRMGRLPILKALPYGTYSVVSLSRESDSSSIDTYPIAKVAPILVPHNLGFCQSQAKSCDSTFSGSEQHDRRHDRDADEGLNRTWEPRIIFAFKRHLQRYRHVNRALSTEEGFFDAHRHFMLGHSFIEAY